jgi:hypothetical protein
LNRILEHKTKENKQHSEKNKVFVQYLTGVKKFDKNNINWEFLDKEFNASETDMIYTGFNFVDLSNTSIYMSFIKDVPGCKGRTFNGANFNSAFVSGFDFNRCTFIGADLRGAHFNNCFFYGEEVLFVGCLVDEKTTFEDCKVEYLNDWICPKTESGLREVLYARGIEDSKKLKLKDKTFPKPVQPLLQNDFVNFLDNGGQDNQDNDDDDEEPPQEDEQPAPVAQQPQAGLASLD